MNSDGGSRLTSREIEILVFVRNGLHDKEIAQRARISERMVKKHIQKICEKLDCKSRAHAMAIALRMGLIRPLD